MVYDETSPTLSFSCLGCHLCNLNWAYIIINSRFDVEFNSLQVSLCSTYVPADYHPMPASEAFKWCCVCPEETVQDKYTLDPKLLFLSHCAHQLLISNALHLSLKFCFNDWFFFFRIWNDDFTLTKMSTLKKLLGKSCHCTQQKNIFH